MKHRKKGRILVSLVLLLVLALAPVHAYAMSPAEAGAIAPLGAYAPGSVYGPSLNQAELNQVKAAVDAFAATVPANASDYDKASLANEYLKATCTYAADWSKNRANTAWGALVYHEAQCSGFARAYKALCDAIGLPCYYVHVDSTVKGMWGSHQWNVVQVDGQWYIVDVTNNTTCQNAFFLVSTDYYVQHTTCTSLERPDVPNCPQNHPRAVTLEALGLKLQMPASEGLAATPEPIMIGTDGTVMITDDWWKPRDANGNIVEAKRRDVTLTKKAEQMSGINAANITQKMATVAGETLLYSWKPSAISEKLLYQCNATCYSYKEYYGPYNSMSGYMGITFLPDKASYDTYVAGLKEPVDALGYHEDAVTASVTEWDSMMGTGFGHRYYLYPDSLMVVNVSIETSAAADPVTSPYETVDSAFYRQMHEMSLQFSKSGSCSCSEFDHMAMNGQFTTLTHWEYEYYSDLYNSRYVVY